MTSGNPRFNVLKAIEDATRYTTVDEWESLEYHITKDWYNPEHEFPLSKLPAKVQEQISAYDIYTHMFYSHYANRNPSESNLGILAAYEMKVAKSSWLQELGDSIESNAELSNWFYNDLDDQEREAYMEQEAEKCINGYKAYWSEKERLERRARSERQNRPLRSRSDTPTARDPSGPPSRPPTPSSPTVTSSDSEAGEKPTT